MSNNCNSCGGYVSAGGECRKCNATQSPKEALPRVWTLMFQSEAAKAIDFISVGSSMVSNEGEMVRVVPESALAEAVRKAVDTIAANFEADGMPNIAAQIRAAAPSAGEEGEREKTEMREVLNMVAMLDAGVPHALLMKDYRGAVLQMNEERHEVAKAARALLSRPSQAEGEE